MTSIEVWTEDFERFVDELLPDDDALLTVDDCARLLQKLRAFMDRQRIPDKQKAAFADALLDSVLQTRTLSPSERQQVMETWAAAFGVETEWHH